MLARSMEQIRKDEREKEEKDKILNIQRRKMFCEINTEELINLVIDNERRVQCSFFKVPDPIRRVSEHSYDPRLISFGLYGRGDERWAQMEKVKLEVASIVLKVLRTVNEDEKMDVHLNVSGEKAKIEAIWNHLCDKIVPVGHNESGQYVWKLYSDAPSDLSFPVVRHLLVLDAVFLVSFMLFQRAQPKTRSFGLAGFEKYEALRRVFTRAGILCNLNIIASDMWLFENQIPLLLIRKMVKEMYVHQEDEERMTSEQKNAAAEEAFEILVKDSVQRVLRVLPGNYRRKPGPEAEENTTDRLLRSTRLRKYSHLLECLYRLVSSVDEKTPMDRPESFTTLPSFSEEKKSHDSFQPILRVVSFVTQIMKGRKRKSEDKATEEKGAKSRGLPISKQPAVSMQKPPPDEEEGFELVRRHSMSQSTQYFGSESLRSGGSGVMYPLSPEPTTGAQQSQDPGEPSGSGGSATPQVEGWPVERYEERVQTSQEIEGPTDLPHSQLQGRENETMAGSSTSGEQSAVSYDGHRQPLMPMISEEVGTSRSRSRDEGSSTDQRPSPSRMRSASSKRKRVSIFEPATVIENESLTSWEQTGLEVARFISNMPKYFDYNYKAAGMHAASAMGGIYNEHFARTRPSEAEEEVLCLNSRFLTSMCARACQPNLKIDSYTLPTVTNLREVGIRVEGDSAPGFNCKVELKDSSLPWGNATLHISPLNVDGNTERFLRNLVAFEIVSTSDHRLLTYLQCLDDLINTQVDVALLKEGRHPVILNSSLDERDVAKLFNRMLLNCTVYHNPQLQDIRSKVRLYYLQQWRRGWTEFKDRYGVFTKPWVAISLLAGFLVLGMTAVQTVYTVIGFYQGS